jgi:hypothetical protein
LQSADDFIEMRWTNIPIAVASVALLSITPPSDAAGGAPPKQILAVGFERNHGQADRNIRFLAHTAGYTIAIYPDGSAQLRPVAGGSDVRLEWLNSFPHSEPLERDPLPSRKNYYRGSDPANWQIDVSLFQRVGIGDLYPGVELSYHIDNDGLEYELVVSPGSDPDRIQLRVPSGWCASIGDSGNLKLIRKGEVLRHRKPVAFQVIDGKTVTVAAAFHVSGDIVTLRLPDGYDSNRPLVIDPVVTFSSYLGGSSWDAAYGVAADSSGNIFVTGETSSQDFPGAPRVARTTRDVFVTKMKDSVVLYTTILASSGNNSGNAIALDSAGRAYVAGTAGAADFPVTAGAAQTAFGGAQDAFVARLDAVGRLDYASFLGGSGSDVATGIALDYSGNAYVTGYTASVNFPVVGAVPQATYRGGFHDAFIAKLNTTGSQFLYATLLGGQGNDVGSAIAVDGAGNAVVAGYTDSFDFPVSQAFQSQPGGNGDGFVASLNPLGTQWNFVTYLGGSGRDQANAVALDGAGNVYVTGATYSTNFPVSTSAYQQTLRGNYDAFVSKLSPAGSFLYGTLLGGSDTDCGNAISVEASGEVWVAGYTASFDFPTLDPVQSSNRGSFDDFISELNNTGSALVFSTYWGGSGDDRIWALALAAPGDIVVAGYTSSVDLTTVAAGALAVPPAGYNAFITQIQGEQPPAVVSVSPNSGIGASQTFTFVFSDPNGATDLLAVGALINGTLSSINSCDLSYAPGTNLLWMTVDNASRWQTPLPLAAPGTLQNSQCSVNLGASSATLSGTQLTLRLAISFKPSFSGQRNIYAMAQDTAGLVAAWLLLGTWTTGSAPNQPPAVVSVSPNSGSGASQTFTFVFSDPNGATDLLAVGALINGTLSSINSCDLSYAPGTNLLWMTVDNASQWQTPLPLAAPGTLQNSQCSVDLGASSATLSGTQLTLRLAISFKPSFSGQRNIYAMAQDTAGLVAAWLLLGTWTAF